MKDDIVIRAEGLGKRYWVGHEAERERYVALRDVLARTARNAWRKTRDLAHGRDIVVGDTVEEFWALRDLSFEVRRGEVLGIIGRNGAGKSTLLKILSRITEPSEGRVTVKGRVASLLEVGTGFHPELTGRENIFLNGAILGMTRASIKRKFDEIVAFSEVEKFLDTPVKRYSSGMYVRLAFGVAAHLDPEILIIDEVLAVGDIEFQRKCLGKIDDVAHSGRTVLFVSHNMQVIESLSKHALLLEDGKLLSDSSTREVLQTYTSRTIGGNRGGDNILYDRGTKSLPTDGGILRVELLDKSGVPMSTLTTNTPVIFRIHFEINRRVARGSIIIQLRSASGPVLLKLENDPALVQLQVNEVSHIDCHVENLPLAPGQYLLSFGIAIYNVQLLDWAEDAGLLTITGSNAPGLRPASNSNALLAIEHNWRGPVPDRSNTREMGDAQ